MKYVLRKFVVTLALAALVLMSAVGTAVAATKSQTHTISFTTNWGRSCVLRSQVGVRDPLPVVRGVWFYGSLSCGVFTSNPSYSGRMQGYERIAAVRRPLGAQQTCTGSYNLCGPMYTSPNGVQGLTYEVETHWEIVFPDGESVSSPPAGCWQTTSSPYKLTCDHPVVSIVA